MKNQSSMVFDQLDFKNCLLSGSSWACLPSQERTRRYKLRQYKGKIVCARYGKSGDIHISLFWGFSALGIWGNTEYNKGAKDVSIHFFISSYFNSACIMAALISMATLLLLLLYFRFFLYRRVAQTNLKLVMSFFNAGASLCPNFFTSLLHILFVPSHCSLGSHHKVCWSFLCPL